MSTTLDFNTPKVEVEAPVAKAVEAPKAPQPK